MKLLIIGGVAGGATAAARARRISESAEITVIERGPFVSYANCGLPYYISRDIQKRSKLLLQTPEGFDSRYGVKVLVDTEAIEIDRQGKRVRAKGPQGESWLGYDALILAQGGNPVMPALAGIDSPNVFRLWTVPDMDRIHAFVEERNPATEEKDKGAIMAGNIVKEKITAGARIIDVRTPAEYKDGAYPGAVNIPLSILPVKMNELEPRDKPIVLYCASGARSGQGARLLKRAGFTDVINAGGLEDMPE